MTKYMCAKTLEIAGETKDIFAAKINVIWILWIAAIAIDIAYFTTDLTSFYIITTLTLFVLFIPVTIATAKLIYNYSLLEDRLMQMYLDGKLSNSPKKSAPQDEQI
jgi:hypothetical protein